MLPPAPPLSATHICSEGTDTRDQCHLITAYGLRGTKCTGASYALAPHGIQVPATGENTIPPAREWVFYKRSTGGVDPYWDTRTISRVSAADVRSPKRIG